MTEFVEVPSGKAILPVSRAGKALEVPASWLGKFLPRVCWVRVSTVGHCVPSFLGSLEINVDICSFSDPKMALILSSVNLYEIPLVGSSIRSESRDAEGPVVFPAPTNILTCEILLFIFSLLSVLRWREKLIKSVRRVNLMWLIYRSNWGKMHRFCKVWSLNRCKAMCFALKVRTPFDWLFFFVFQCSLNVVFSLHGRISRRSRDQC